MISVDDEGKIDIEGEHAVLAVQLMHMMIAFLKSGIFCDIELFAMLQAACDHVEEEKEC